MRRVALLLALAGWMWGGMPQCFGACPKGGCRSPNRAAAAPTFSTVRHATDPSWEGLYFGNEQIAALDKRTGDVYPINRGSGEFEIDPPQAVGQARADDVLAPGPQGMDRRGILKKGERWTMNGEPSSGPRVRRAIGGSVGVSASVPDDSASPSLTIIGSQEECNGFLSAIKGDATAAELSGKYLVQSFRPSNPLVAGSGFVLDGRPSIYGQMPDGRTVFRSMGMASMDDLVGAMMRGIEMVEGKRSPDPGYNPQADAGLVVSPKVDATVTPPPWIYILTHLGALFVGGVSALGGRWAIAAMLLTPMIEELEKRLADRMAANQIAAVQPAPPQRPAG